MITGSEEALALSLAAGLLTRCAIYLASRRQKRKYVLAVRSRIGHVAGICIPRAGGKSFIARKLTDHHNTVLVDMDEMLKEKLGKEKYYELRDLDKNQKIVRLYPHAAEMVADCVTRHKKTHRVLFLCSDHEMLTYCRIRDVKLFLPNRDNFRAICSKEANKDRKDELFDNFCYLLQSGMHIVYFENCNHLSSLIKQYYQLEVAL